jgi:uncharacterized protein YjeT (DUF2065 family)
MLKLLAIAFALILVIEGVLYALFPDGMKRMLVRMVDVPASSLRSAGLLSAVIGVVVVWLVRG